MEGQALPSHLIHGEHMTTSAGKAPNNLSISPDVAFSENNMTIPERSADSGGDQTTSMERAPINLSISPDVAISENTMTVPEKSVDSGGDQTTSMERAPINLSISPNVVVSEKTTMTIQEKSAESSGDKTTSAKSTMFNLSISPEIVASESTTTMITNCGDVPGGDFASQDTSHSDQAAHSSATEEVTMEVPTIPQISLRRFPAEIRLRIFNEVFTEGDNPRNTSGSHVSPIHEIIVPSEKEGIIEVLRGGRDQRLYREALEVYYKKVTVEVTEENIERIQGMNGGTLSLINHLCVTYSLPTPKPRSFALAPLIQPTDRLIQSMANSLKSLTLLFEPKIALSQACVALPYEIPVLVNSFTKLESLTIILPDEAKWLDTLEGPERQQCAFDLVHTCREAFRLNGSVWTDWYHQIRKLQYVAPPKNSETHQGKGKGIHTGSKSKEKERLEWKEERVGDGWVGQCVCGGDHGNSQDDIDIAHDGDADTLPSLDEMATMLGMGLPNAIPAGQAQLSSQIVGGTDLPPYWPDYYENIAQEGASSLASIQHDDDNESPSPTEHSLSTPSTSTPAGTYPEMTWARSVNPCYGAADEPETYEDEDETYEDSEIINGEWDNDDYEEGIYNEDGEEFY